MKIKDLKDKHPRIYDLAMLRQKEAENKADDEANLVDADESFAWTKTKEGSELWNNIDNGYFQFFYDKYPEPITEIKKGDRFMCVKDVYMYNNTNDVAYINGKEYIVEDSYNSYRINLPSELYKKHTWTTNSCKFTDSFQLITEETSSPEPLTHEQVENNCKEKFNQGIPESTKPDYYNFAINEAKCDLFDIAEAMGLSIRLFSALKYFRVKGGKLKQINDLQKAKECIDLEIERLRK